MIHGGYHMNIVIVQLKKEIPSLIITLQQLYETSGDAEAFSLSTLLASTLILSGVLHILARMNATLQREKADFSKLQILLQLTFEELVSLKHEHAEWCSEIESWLEILEEHSNEIGFHNSGSARSKFN